MSTQQAAAPRAHGILRIAVVALIAVWSLTLAGGASISLLTPPLHTGFHFDGNWVVDAVAPGSGAAAAGLARGDRLIPPIPYRLRVTNGPTTLHVVRNGIARTLTVVPRAAPLPLVRKIVFVAKAAVALLFLSLGSLLVLMRPSPMTWCFYLWCANARHFSIGEYWLGSDAIAAFAGYSSILLAAVSIPLILVFAARFPNNVAPGWRATAERVAYVFLALFVCYWAYYVVGDQLGLPEQVVHDAWSASIAFVYLTASLVLVATYLSSSGADRHRLGWVLVFPVVLVLRVVAVTLRESARFWYPAWIDDLSVLLGACVPVAVTYAVIRYRVFDLTFFISRTIAYGALSTLIVGVISLIHWFAGKQLEQTHLGFVAEVGAALALGFWVKGLHGRAERLVDATFFRHRHLAERQLARTASALLHAGSRSAINDMLVHEPSAALGLASAAVFRISEDGAFHREAAAGWIDSDAHVLDSEDPLILHLKAEHAALRMHELRWTRHDEPSGAAEPTLALPILIRRHLNGIVLYGAHEHGADIDPDEERSLTGLAASAAIAYEHVEAETLRAENAALRHEIASIRTVRKRTTRASGSARPTG
ncbi:MAG: hypothetical protein JWO66_2399 [Candidatus Eremiobacteraeota bacterium]|nr:hypothetical protein [Candidatus Eremiobacteraeota bacterium]